MSFFTWNEKYSVGIRELDAQHKQLITLLNELYEAMQNGAAESKLAKIINELVNYTRTHFATEEKYMEKYNYIGLSSQKSEHSRFIEKINAFKQDYDAGKVALSLSLASFLKDWLSSHILGSDKQYGPVLTARGAS